MAYSACPKCGFRFSWFRKWKLSAQNVYPCPRCHVGLLKDSESEKYIKWGAIFCLITQIPIWLNLANRDLFQINITGTVKLFPVVFLIVVSFSILSAVLTIKGLRRAKFVVAEDMECQT